MRKLILAAALSVAALPLGAANVSGVNLEDRITVNNQALVLNGGALRKKFVVKVYVGGLYLPAKQSNAATDVPKGSKIVLTYVPGMGTTVEVNGKNKGTLGGKAVSDAILNTWLGPKPGPGADFKKGILGAS